MAERVPEPKGLNATDALYLGGAALLVALLAALLIRATRRRSRPARLRSRESA